LQQRQPTGNAWPRYATNMQPAIAWDDSEGNGNRARGWTVIGTLREHREVHVQEAVAARRRAAERSGESFLMTAAVMQQEYEDAIKARWHGGPTVLAFLFTQPDSRAIQMLDARGDYFDVRTGDTWDLFFPGYYRSAENVESEQRVGSQPVGHGFASDWYFNPVCFNNLRDHIERSSEHRWNYSGGTDLVLINGWLVDYGEPTIDWISTISGQITDQGPDTNTPTLASLIERITRDLETGTEDPSYGISQITNEPPPPGSHISRDFMVATLSGIAAALGARALGA
jgi:hypothetical protein